MDDPPKIGAPLVWIIVFCRHSSTWWIEALPGTYKHVRAYAFVPPLSSWLFYDVSLSGTVIYTAPDGAAAEAYIGEFTRDADLVGFRPVPGTKRLRIRPFTCVSAIAHLVGVRSGALRPDRLYRDLVAAGGTPLGQQRPATGPGLRDAAT